MTTYATKSLSPSDKVCGDVPSPLLVSDGNDAGCGFKLAIMTIHKDSEAGEHTYTVETPTLSFLTPLK